MRGMSRRADHAWGVEGSVRVQEAELLQLDVNSTTVGPQMTPAELARRDALFRADPNGAAGLMYLDRIDTGDQGFGSVTDGWGRDDMGVVFAARADGLPFMKQHIELMVEYVKREVKPMIDEAISGLQPGSVVLQQEEILNKITPHAFGVFCSNYKLSKSLENGIWTHVPTPY